MQARRSVAAVAVVVVLLAGREALAGSCTGGNCPAANLVVYGFPSPSSAGSAGSIVVEVHTSTGVVASGYTETIHFTSTDAQAVLPANYTFTSSTATSPNCSSNCDQGVHTFTNGVTLATAGTQSVNATDISKSTVTGSQIGIVVTALPASSFIVSGISTPRTAGTVSSVTVEARDTYGNRVANYLGTVHFTSTDPQATLPANYPFTSTDAGIHTFTNGATLKTSGTQSVTATDAANSNLQGVESAIQVNPGPSSTLIVSGITSPDTQGLAASVRVEVRDAYGNRVTTDTGTITFSSSDAQAVLPSNYRFTSTDAGIHTFASGVTLQTIGTQSVTATNSHTSTITGSQTGIVVVSNAAVSLNVSGIPNSVIAGASNSVTVDTRDAAGNRSTVYRGTVHFSSTDGQASLPANYAFTSTDLGVHAFTGVVLKNAGTQSLSATDTMTGSINGAEGGISVNAASAQLFVVSGFPSPATAGLAGGITVEARDAFGNRAVGYQGTVHFTSSDPLALLPPNTTFAAGNQGIKTFSGAVLMTPGTQSITAADGSIAGSETGISVVLGPPPPDPATVAPPIDPTVATDFATVTAFLYTGSNPTQLGVPPGTIQPQRVAILRGLVKTNTGAALAAVEISVLGHPEFGITQSRSDGRFDLAVNGGGHLILSYTKSGWLPAQRALDTSWRDYANLPDVTMLGYDTQVTTISSSATQFQIARGSVSSDSDGSRQATVFFPPGTQATLTLPSGSVPLSTYNVRATEYTVGPGGASAMPGELPPTSGYTYAVELSLDEAVVASATAVQFNQPVYSYVENFLAFRVGTAVPVGYYDRTQAKWVGSANGIILGVLALVNGLPGIDLDGSGVPASSTALAAIGLSDAERATIASIYSTGKTLWRVPLTHFTPGDYNYGYSYPNDAVRPQPSPPSPNPPLDDPCCDVGSVIEAENQILGEDLPLVGTPHSLHYQSERTRGFRPPLTIPISGATVPATLQSIGLSVQVAGHQYTYALSPSANQTFAFSDWDGTDVYGRTLQGAQRVSIAISYCYALVLLPSTGWAGYPSPGQALGSFSNGSRRACLTTNSSSTITRWDATAAENLAGWSFSAHHSYDPTSGTLYFGDGRRSSPTSVANVITHVAGTLGSDFGGTGTSADGISALQADLDSGGRAVQIAVAPDSSVYLAYNTDDGTWCGGGGLVRRISPAGIITTIAGTLPTSGSCGSSGDGGPAISAYIPWIDQIAIGVDGSIYFSEFANVGTNPSAQRTYRVRKVTPDGLINTTLPVMAVPSGNCSNGSLPTSLAVGPDGTIYEMLWPKVLGSAPGQAPTTIVDLSLLGYPILRSGSCNTPYPTPHIALAPDGGIIVAAGPHILRVNTNGSVTSVAGNGTYVDALNNPCANNWTSTGTGNGGPATSAGVLPEEIAVDAMGSIIFKDPYCSSTHVLRVIRGDGVVIPFAGNGSTSWNEGIRDYGDNGPAVQAFIIDDLGNLATTADRRGVLMAGLNQDPATWSLCNTCTYLAIRQISPAFQSYSVSQFVFPSKDGQEIYVFDQFGRHLATKDATTGVLRWSFAYDGSGRLTGIADQYGSATTIDRDASTGAPRGIVGPYGQRTTLSIDSYGHLTTVQNPNNETVHVTHDSNGLLRTLTDAKSQVHSFNFDSLGRLQSDANPAGGSKTLVRSGIDPNVSVGVTTALGRTTTYGMQFAADGSQTRTTILPTGLTTTQHRNLDLSGTATYPDGTIVTTAAEVPDSRFGIQAPIVPTVTTATPSGLTRTESRSRTVTLHDPTNLLSVASLVETVGINGKQYQSSYDATSKTVTLRTPGGRQETISLDTFGRIAQAQPPGVLSMSVQYDALGRPQTATQGTRTYSFTYDALGRVLTVANPMHSESFGYDSANRITGVALPDSTSSGYIYDLNGNLLSLTPPGSSAHAFTYQGTDLEQDYTPPPVDANGTGHVLIAYDLDQNISSISATGVPAVTPTYDTASGRLLSVTFSAGTISYGYNASSGFVTSIIAPGGTQISYTFDGSLPTSTTWSGGPVIGTVSRRFDNDFRVASDTVAGQIATYGYDSDGLLTNAGAVTIARDPTTGFVTGTVLSAVSESLAYNSYGEEQTYAASYNGSVLFSIDFGTSDNLGRIVTKTETVEGVTHSHSYSYDAGGRITDVSTDGIPTSHYGYDANGNRATGPGLTVAPSYDAQDRLLTYGPCSYAYKSDGSLQTRTCSSGTTTYDFDPFGNLSHVTLPSATTIDYVIDGVNRRIGKKVNGALAEGLLYRDQLQPVAWLNGDGSVRATFVYGLHSNVPEYMIQGTTTYRLITDQIGSVRIVVNTATGALAERLDYDEFGNVLSDTAPGAQPFGFAGGLRDLDTGLTRFGARDYDPATGRWMTKDPLLFRGGATNLYEYAGSDPVNHNDPSGLTVSCTYDKATGQLVCTDDTTGASASGPAESGGKPYGDPIPDGVYEILAREGKTGFFRLDPLDSNPRDDIHQPTGRHNFRLHYPGRTIGCIAAKDSDDWKRIDSLIRNTSGTFGVRDRAPVSSFRFWVPIVRYVTYYGTLTVRSR